MKIKILCFILLIAGIDISIINAQNSANNPVIFADVPDMSIIRVGDTYYMSSTTMHMSPGLPIMKSTDLVNWELVSYAYDILDDVDALNLENGQFAYGGGSWASSLRYHDGRYVVGTFTGRINKTYIYTTEDIENGPWEKISFSPSYHDHTIYFDDDGKIYMIWGVGDLMMVELKQDLSGVKEDTERVLIENASAPAGDDIMLHAEGSQIFKVDDYYYLFNITWPTDGMRTVLIHRAEDITGPYESRLALQDRGIAQGGLIDTPEGDWYAYLFRDYGSVGRIPYLVPVTWEDGWPVLGVDGEVPDQLDLPASKGLIPGIVASDDFKRRPGEPDLSLVWQWNHNPVDEYWSINRRDGYLRLTNGRIDDNFLISQNTLTQRTIGPVSSGATKIDLSNMKEGDFAGLALLQYRHGKVGVTYEDGKKSVVMVHAEGDDIDEMERIPLDQNTIYLKAECDFRDMADTAYFYFSLDGDEWTRIGSKLEMQYTLPHFMGYRFALFNYATQSIGGYVDFIDFSIDDKISR